MWRLETAYKCGDVLKKRSQKVPTQSRKDEASVERRKLVGKEDRQWEVQGKKRMGWGKNVWMWGVGGERYRKDWKEENIGW